MIESFFQSLKTGGTEYLLISGQATVLYGAATFSEDIDLWVNPTPTNAERFLKALRSCEARYYKLTPPWEIRRLTQGHGFHFILPAADGEDLYLDVMGAPPRVRSFSEATKESQWMETDWGSVHVIGILDLIELKKTQRLEDYPIISRLALTWLQHLGHPPTNADYRWALDHIFTFPELQALLEQHPDAANLLHENAPKCFSEYATGLSQGQTDQVEAEVASFLQSRISKLQDADRRYWRRIILELKELREEDRLMPEGAIV